MKMQLPALLVCASFAASAGCDAGSDELDTAGDTADASSDAFDDTDAGDSADTRVDAQADGTDAVADTQFDEPMPAPTLTELRAELFQPGCSFSTCHGGRSGAAGLNLVTNTWEALVNAEANDAPGRVLVVPGDVDASYLYEKLASDSPEVGERMPPGSALDERRLDMVRRWIEAGALDN